jgi:hypothetical protein
VSKYDIDLVLRSSSRSQGSAKISVVDAVDVEWGVAETKSNVKIVDVVKTNISELRADESWNVPMVVVVPMNHE